MASVLTHHGGSGAPRAKLKTPNPRASSLCALGKTTLGAQESLTLGALFLESHDCVEGLSVLLWPPLRAPLPPARCAARHPPPVLIGHAASLTPY